MSRRAIRVERLFAVLGGLVLMLGGVIVWQLTRNGFGPDEPTPEGRAQTQASAIFGVGARVTYTERGKRSAVCGYIAHQGSMVAFVSRPNRLLLETDPLRREFDDMMGDLCPGFLRAPRTRP